MQSLINCIKKLQTLRSEDQNKNKFVVKAIGNQRDLYLNVWPIMLDVDVIYDTQNQLLVNLPATTAIDAVILDTSKVDVNMVKNYASLKIGIIINKNNEFSIIFPKIS